MRIASTHIMHWPVVWQEHSNKRNTTVSAIFLFGVIRYLPQRYFSGHPTTSFVSLMLTFTETALPSVRAHVMPTLILPAPSVTATILSYS